MLEAFVTTGHSFALVREPKCFEGKVFNA